MAVADTPELLVVDAAAWRRWLAEHADTHTGVFLVLAKKGTTRPTTLTYEQALQEALCWGWIDGQVRRRDEATVGQRFTPRGPRSRWSARNVDRIAVLEREGRMTPRGTAEVARAKADGRWADAYEGPATAVAPPALLAAIAAEPRAQAMWDVLTSQNRYAILHRLGALKTDAGRERAIARAVDQLSRGETAYPQKRRPPEA